MISLNVSAVIPFLILSISLSGSELICTSSISSGVSLFSLYIARFPLNSPKIYLVFKLSNGSVWAKVGLVIAEIHIVTVAMPTANKRIIPLILVPIIISPFKIIYYIIP